MKEKLNNLWQKCKEKFVELYLYYIQGIEIGPRVERRMVKFQNKFERMMRRRGITLIIAQNPDKTISLSFVPEKTWNEQKAMVDAELAKEKSEMDSKLKENLADTLSGIGDPIGTNEKEN